MPFSFGLDLGPFSFGYDNRPGPFPPNENYQYSGSSSFGQTGGSTTSQTVNFPMEVWGPQASYLQDLYGMSANLLTSPAHLQNQAAAQQLVNMGAGGIEQLLNPQVNPVLQVYQEQLAQGMEQNILPQIRREAQGFGQLGGGRQGVAEGLAAQEASRMMQDFAAQVYSSDMDRLLGGIQTIPGLAQAGLGIPWYGLQQHAGILGSPHNVGGGGFSTTNQSNFGVEGSNTFGESFTAPNVFGPGGVGPGAPPVAPPPGGPVIDPNNPNPAPGNLPNPLGVFNPNR